MSIAENIVYFKQKLPADVTLVAVSKTKPVEDLMQAYEAGQRIFGENKIQEMVAKHEQLPKDIEWHMIGHVQSNKVRLMAPFVSLVHGVDSLKLLEEINRQGEKNNRTINCLLQVFIATEQSKFGLDPDELFEIIDHNLHKLPFVKVSGLMGMASFSEDTRKIRNEFTRLKAIFDKAAERDKNFTTLSMGMSGDFMIAIECGSTMVRIGSSIFGERIHS